MKTDLIPLLSIFIAVFCFLGWYFAETENEILRKELAVQSYSQPVHIEDTQHDR